MEGRMERGQVQQHCHPVPFCHQKPPGWEKQDHFVLFRGSRSSSPLGEHQSRAWVPCPSTQLFWGRKRSLKACPDLWRQRADLKMDCLPLLKLWSGKISIFMLYILITVL